MSTFNTLNESQDLSKNYRKFSVEDRFKTDSIKSPFKNEFFEKKKIIFNFNLINSFYYTLILL